MSEHGVGSLIDGLPDTQESRREQKRRDRRGSRRALIVMLSIFGLIIGTGVAYVGYLAFTVGNNIDQGIELGERQPVTAPDGEPVAETGTGTNFLVLGSDTRPGDAGRSDVIVLVHVPEDNSAVQMIHFPRDLYVDIPGHGKNKINAAYAFGREPLLVQTMEQLLGVRIHHVARTDFEGFKNMTDAVGGVRVYAEEGGADGIVKGWNDLDGEQALAFVRERYTLSEGDISRGRRQLAFIKALMLEATKPENIANPITVARFANAATENLVVDKGLTTRAMTDYAIALRNVRGGDVVFATAPFSGYGTSPQGASIDIVDEAGMAELGEALRTDSMDTYLDVFVTP